MQKIADNVALTKLIERLIEDCVIAGEEPESAGDIDKTWFESFFSSFKVIPCRSGTRGQQTILPAGTSELEVYRVNHGMSDVVRWADVY